MQTQLKSDLIPPPPPHEQVRFIYFQTWPFNKYRDAAAYSCGVCEYDDFVEIKDTLESIGQRTWWKEITL
jgi:hypothetical protein